MKKLSLFILVCIVLFGSVGLSWSGTKTLTFAWQQDLPTPVNDLAGWRLYQSTTPGASCKATKVGGDIVFISQQVEYTSSVSIAAPDNQRTTLYFSVTAFDISGNESGCSNEVVAVIDFQAPTIPVQLKVTITTP